MRTSKSIDLSGGTTRFISLVGILIGILSLAGLGSKPAFAETQNDAVGFSSTHVFEAAEAGENIDVLSGNLSLTIPIGPRYKLNDNFEYGLTLYYNSKVWEHECPNGRPSSYNLCPGTLALASPYGLGFTLIPGRVYHHANDKSYVFRLRLEDGSEHFFCDPSVSGYSNDPSYSPNLPNCSTDVWGTMYTTDSSHIRIDHYYPPGTPNAQGWKATMPDGRKIVFGQILNTTTHESLATRVASADIRPDGSPAEFVDYVYTSTTSTSLARIEDSQGRETSFTYGGLGYPYGANDIAIDVPAFANQESLSATTTARYILRRTSSLAIHDPSAGVTGSQWPTLLTGIDFPSSSSATVPRYLFDYGPDNTTVKRRGYVLKRTLPTGATVDYLYDMYETSDYRPYHVELVGKTLTTSTVPYEWTWKRFTDDETYPNQTFVSTNPYRVDVVDPFGNLTQYDFGHSTNSLGYSLYCTNKGECRNNWWDGLLSRVSTYVGPEADTTRLVKRVGYVWDSDLDPIPSRSMSEGHAMFQYRQPVDTLLTSAHAMAVNARQIESTTFIPGANGTEGHSVKVKYSNWSGLCPQQTDEYVDDVLYRTTIKSSSVAGCLFPLYVEVRDAAGGLVSRVDRKYKGARVECEVRWGGISTPHAIQDCTTLVPPTNLSPGDVASISAFDSMNSWATTATAVRGGDDGGNASATLQYLQFPRASDGQLENTGYLKSKTYDTMSWKAIDRTVDFNTGLTAATRDPAGNTTRYHWDTLGRLTSIEPTLPEAPTTITYPSLRETHVRQELDTDNFTETIYLYDDLGRLTTSKRRTATGTLDFQQTEYDIAGRVTRKSEWASEGTPAANLKWTGYDYTSYSDPDAPVGTISTHPDPLGRIRSVTTPDDPTPSTPTTETSYNGTSTSVTVHDIRGWSNGVGTDLSSTTVYTKDPLGRLVSVDSAGPGADATYVYDESDNLTEVRLVDPAAPTHVQVRLFEYDPLGRLRAASNPENGTVEYTRYDARGNLLSYTDARHNVFNMTYDFADRLLTRMQHVGSSDLSLVENVYDSDSPFSTPGRLLRQDSFKIVNSVVNNAETKSSVLVSRDRFGYGAPDSAVSCSSWSASYTGLNGRANWRTTSIQPWNVDLRTEYCQNAMGVSTTISYPDVAGSTRTRTKAESSFRNGYLADLHDNGRESQYVTNVGYAAGGTPTEIGRMGTRDVITLDPRNRPARLQTIGYQFVSSGSPPGMVTCSEAHDNPETHPHLAEMQCGDGEGGSSGGWVPFTIWDSGDYVYDMAGNVQSIGDEQYYYDALSRLVHGSIPDVGTTHLLDYGYDAFGNMTSQSRVNSSNSLITAQYSYTTDWQTNRLTQQSSLGASQVQPTYDENGNLTSDGARGFVFDAESRLREVMDPEKGRIGNYDYDASGYRVRTEADGTETFYFRDTAGQVLSEFQRPLGTTTTPIWNKDYIYAFGKSIALVKNDSPGIPKRPVVTALGSTGLSIKWDAVNEPDILGYSLERRYKKDANTAESAPTYISLPASPTTWTDTWTVAATAGTYLKYKLMALDSAGNLSAPGAQLVVYPFSGTAIPTAPGGVTATPGDRSVRIRWNAVTSSNNTLLGYFVERGNSAGAASSFVRLDDDPLSATEFLDTGLINGQQYSYRVVTVDTANRVSLPSSAAFATPLDSIAPGRIIDVFAEPGRPLQTVVVYWSRGFDPDVASYRVYRSTVSGTLGSQVAAAPVTAGQDSYSATDVTATQGSTYFYSIVAVDTSGNLSTASDQVAVRPRHSGILVPTLTYAAFYIDDRGTTSPDGAPGETTRHNGDVSKENDDIIEVKVIWSNTSDTPNSYRVYRKAPEESQYKLIASPAYVSGATMTFYDTTVTAGDYFYYVTARKLVNNVWEESAATALGVTPDHPVRPFPAHTKVRNLIAADGRFLFDTWNAASRHVTVTWSRVTEPDLVGYNVYRSCNWFAGCWGGATDEMATFACEPVWVRLNTSPLSPEQRSFEDSTTGGLEGCFRYAVRPVGPNGVEGDIDKIVEGNLIDYSTGTGNLGSQVHSHAAGFLPNIPTQDPPPLGPPPQYANWVWEVPASTLLDPPNGINGKIRGTGNPSGSPAAPTGVTHYVAVKDLYQNNQQTQYAQVLWSMSSPPSDLLGFHVEVAGSRDGPWRRLTQRPVAWWERRYIAQGVGTYRCGGYSGHTGCLSFRVIAIDEAGNESAPALSGSNPTASACPATLEPPANLRASTYSSNPCKIQLTWDAPANATASTEYYVYRLPISSIEHRFYDTKRVVGATSFIEEGSDILSPSANCADTNCPYWGYGSSGAVPLCNIQLIEAYYVTARQGSGGESPRSNLVFWQCGNPVGYASLLAQDDSGNAIALLDVQPTDETLACWIDDAASNHQSESVADVRSSEHRSSVLGAAPMLHLGAIVDPKWTVFDLHSDPLGSVRAVTSTSSIARHDYFPFGQEITSLLSFNSHRYTGHERDRETKLDYMKARYYGAASGRFSSPDPMNAVAIRERESFLGVPGNWNKFSYALSNPLKFKDGSGKTIEYAPSYIETNKTDPAFHAAHQRFINNLEGGWLHNMLGRSSTLYRFEAVTQKQLNQLIPPTGEGTVGGVTDFSNFPELVTIYIGKDVYNLSKQAIIYHECKHCSNNEKYHGDPVTLKLMDSLLQEDGKSGPKDAGSMAFDAYDVWYNGAKGDEVPHGEGSLDHIGVYVNGVPQ